MRLPSPREPKYIEATFSGARRKFRVLSNQDMYTMRIADNGNTLDQLHMHRVSH